MEGLTEDLIISIISRLSIKCVVRCRCVCKSWDATLSSPSFARAHYERASTLNPITNYIITYFKFSHENHLYFVEDDREDQEAYTTTNDQEEPEKETVTLSNVKPLNFPFLLTDYCITQDKRSILMGACHGFLCFSTVDVLFGGGTCPTNPIYLFNPINGEHLLLPEFEEASFIIPAYGFGFDASRQEYKVVLVYFHAKCGEKDLVQVHTVGSDLWRRKDNVPQFLTDDPHKVETSLPLSFNGSIHWIVLNSVEDGHKRAYILSFQLDTEEFGFIPMPEPLRVLKTSIRNTMEYALQLSGGCLSIIYSPRKSFVDIWVMKNYNVKESWIKQYSFGPNYSLLFSHMPLGFRKNGELMLSLDNCKLASYNTDKGRYKILKLDGELQGPHLITVPFPFVGSFISLKSAHGGKLADNKVIGTSGFRNPIRRQQWIGIVENGSYRARILE